VGMVRHRGLRGKRLWGGGVGGCIDIYVHNRAGFNEEAKIVPGRGCGCDSEKNLAVRFKKHILIGQS
jgi:hypothetical protein